MLDELVLWGYVIWRLAELSSRPRGVAGTPSIW